MGDGPPPDDPLPSSEVARALEDFRDRCAAPGVIVCQGWEDPSAFRRVTEPDSGLYPRLSNGVYKGSQDTTFMASGHGSLRFEVSGKTSADAAGRWLQAFGRSFGEGTAFYVQFQQRFSREMLEIDFHSIGGSWKQVIFHHDNATCSDLELTTHQRYHQRIPQMYTECGARGVFTNNGEPPYLIQQGNYNCWFGRVNSKDCFMYPAEKWITFYYEVAIGHWGKPDSSVRAWVSLDGEPYKQWINLPKFVLNNDTPGDDYNHLTLTPYMSGKDPSIAHPTAYTWYDELIVSSQPITYPR